jgi:very-short-patch-repair endonuclease/predicted transcriptional regulator of viral defense system
VESIDLATRNRLTSPDTLLAEIAGRQHGLARTQDLRAAGISPAAASRRRKRGLLHRVHLGVDAVGHTALSREARCLAAVFAAGEGSALDDRAAADLWRIRRGRPAPITVVSPRRVRIKGVVVHHCNRLDPRDVTIRNGIPVTTVSRTIVDLAETETVERLTNMMYEAAYLGLLDLDELRAAAARVEGRHRLWVLDEAIEAHLMGSAGTKSDKEDLFHALSRGRFPKGIANVKVLGHEVDAYWPEFKLIAEVDGPPHERPRAKRRDRRRDRELKAAGFTVLRFPTAEIEQRPEDVAAAVQAAMNGIPT